MPARRYNTKYLTLAYVVALVLIAALSASGHAIIRLTLKQQDSDARLINLAGRQRMLSQKLAKNALLLAKNNTDADRDNAIHVIATDLTNWTRVQSALKFGDAGLGLPENQDAEVAAYFREMEPHFQKMSDGLEEMLKTARGGTFKFDPESKPLAGVVQSSRAYLELMDKATFEFQKKADERVRTLKYNETIILVSILSLLSIEAIFIFRPIVGKVDGAYADIEKLNGELEETVERRVAELVALNERLGEEIAERKRDAESLRRADSEKETLIHEIHHRVKNNLQVVASILNIKSAKIKNPADAAAFKESIALIRSISKVHERLYVKGEVASIKMDEYISDLVDDLVRAYAVPAGKIRFYVSVGDVHLHGDKAIPCGLIINELVTNVIKYAFPGAASGESRITLNRSGEGTLDLAVSDNGVGFQPEKNGEKTDSVGLELVSRIAGNQLGGTMGIISSENKTEIRVRFSDAN
jgi:two-component sensor histidine kinase